MIFCFRRPQYFTSHTGFSWSPGTWNRLSNRNVSLGCLWFRGFQYGGRITIIIVIIIIIYNHHSSRPWQLTAAVKERKSLSNRGDQRQEAVPSAAYSGQRCVAFFSHGNATVTRSLVAEISISRYSSQSKQQNMSCTSRRWMDGVWSRRW